MPLKDLSQICIAKDRVVLIGDAAHAVTPNLGQGAAIGLEDAELLAYYLDTSESIQSALQAFEKRRYKRVEAIKNKSYIIGKIAQSSSPLFIDFCLRASSPKIRLKHLGNAEKVARYEHDFHNVYFAAWHHHLFLGS